MFLYMKIVTIETFKPTIHIGLLYNWTYIFTTVKECIAMRFSKQCRKGYTIYNEASVETFLCRHPFLQHTMLMQLLTAQLRRKLVLALIFSFDGKEIPTYTMCTIKLPCLNYLFNPSPRAKLLYTFWN